MPQNVLATSVKTCFNRNYLHVPKTHSYNNPSPTLCCAFDSTAIHLLPKVQTAKAKQRTTIYLYMLRIKMSISRPLYGDKLLQVPKRMNHQDSLLYARDIVFSRSLKALVTTCETTKNCLHSSNPLYSAYLFFQFLQKFFLGEQLPWE